jgi:hypothetical protein
MNHIKEYVIGFVECTIDYKEFVQKCRSDSEIFDWLQSIVPQGLTCHKYTFDAYHQLIGDEVIPYDIRVVTDFTDGSDHTVLGYALNLQATIHQLLTKAFPNENVIKGDHISSLFNIILDACPSYIGGPEVENAGIFEKLLTILPLDATYKQRTKLFKNAALELFHIDGKNCPRWINGPEWPISSTGKPLRFTSQKKRKDIEYDTILYTDYFFEDVDTGEVRVVSQFT